MFEGGEGGFGGPAGADRAVADFAAAHDAFGTEIGGEGDATAEGQTRQVSGMRRFGFRSDRDRAFGCIDARSGAPRGFALSTGLAMTTRRTA